MKVKKEEKGKKVRIDVCRVPKRTDRTCETSRVYNNNAGEGGENKLTFNPQ